MTRFLRCLVLVVAPLLLMSAALAEEGESVVVEEETTVVEPAAVNEPAAEVPTAEEPGLEQLDWLVGDWVDEDDQSRVAFSVEWVAKGKFLRRTFAVSDEEGVVMEGTQVLGWDPANKRIRSWTFDTEGGFGEAFWTRDGDRWIAKKTFTLATGEKASALNVITMIDGDSFQWLSLNREVGGEFQPNAGPVTIVRKTVEQEESK